MESSSEPPHDWRIWFDDVTGLWHGQRWDGIGGICTAKTLEIRAHVHTRGKHLLVKHAEAKVGANTWIQNSNFHTDVLRLVPRSQYIGVPVVGPSTRKNPPQRVVVPVMGAGAKATKPG